VAGSGRDVAVAPLEVPAPARHAAPVTSATAPLRVGILLFDEVEVLDACGPFEVFSVAGRVAVRAGRPAPFEVVLIAAGGTGGTGGTAGAPGVRARGGLRLGADAGLDDAPGCDVVLVPGGVVDAVAADPAVRAWLRRGRARARVVASVCTGAFVLAAAGLLDERPVTTHWEDVAALRAGHPHLRVVEGVRFVDHGDLATGAGISAALDLALHLVGRLAGEDLAVATARQMDYAWRR
jgi:transcriptional regulator GlxA family with amidase domain